MCLDYKLSKKEKEEWLKDKPDTIIAYKSVVKGTSIDDDPAPRLYPLYNYRNKKPFKRKNRVCFSFRRICSMLFRKNANTIFYMAYFHLYVNPGSGRIKCEIPKKDITSIGMQFDEVIVTKCFTIVGEDKYLD